MNPRIKVTLNKGRKGMPLDKLGAVAEHTAKFLKALGSDLGTAGDSEWIADNFSNGSVMFDIEDPSIPSSESERWRRGLRAVMGNDFSDPEINLLVQRHTRNEYAAIGRVIDADEAIEFGVYANGTADNIDTYVLTKQEAEAEADVRPENFLYHGEIQGVVHALFKESKTPRLSIRELSTGELVDCYFQPALYANAIETLVDPDAVVFVEGDATEDADLGRITRIEVKHFRVAPAFNQASFEKMIGAFPRALTGGKNTARLMDAYRD